MFSDEQMASLAGALLDLCRLYIQLRMTEPLAFEASTEAASADVVVRPSVPPNFIVVAIACIQGRKTLDSPLSLDDVNQEH